MICRSFFIPYSVHIPTTSKHDTMKIWFSLYDRDGYTGPEPAFYDTAQLPFTALIESNYSMIKEELDAYLSEHQLESYFNTSMVNRVNSWKTISLKAWSINLYQHQKHFPKTLALINSVDGLVSASFNLLGPKSIIKAHYGDTNAIFRCHMGLQVPAQMPYCGFRVKDEWRSWENGKLLAFVDANHHEAINQSGENRFIFLFDVIRPEYLHRKQYICATVMTSLFMQARAEKFRILYIAPLWMQKLMGRILTPFAFMAIHTRNFLYKFFQR